MNKTEIKTHASTYAFKRIAENGENIERNLVEYITKANRIDKASTSFDNIRNQVKIRQTTAVLYRVMMMPDVILTTYDKELPASFKVLYVKDIRTSDKRPKVFIDVTGLLQFVNGQWTTKEIDKLCAYLIGALAYLVYYTDPNRFMVNSTITTNATICYTKLFTGVIDNLRPINYTENKLKISYIVSVYFLVTMMNKDVREAQKIATHIIQANPREVSAWDYYYTEDDFVDIKTFVDMLATTFKLKGLDYDTFFNRWMILMGKGAVYALELLPAFIVTMGYSYVGAYLNNQKYIESTCGKAGIELVEALLRTGADLYNRGFKYESADTRIDIDDHNR